MSVSEDLQSSPPPRHPLFSFIDGLSTTTLKTFCWSLVALFALSGVAVYVGALKYVSLIAAMIGAGIAASVALIVSVFIMLAEAFTLIKDIQATDPVWRRAGKITGWGFPLLLGFIGAGLFLLFMFTR
jgi:hypothetical protein